jgi:hypothetical protein
MRGNRIFAMVLLLALPALAAHWVYQLSGNSLPGIDWAQGTTGLVEVRTADTGAPSLQWRKQVDSLPWQTVTGTPPPWLADAQSENLAGYTLAALYDVVVNGVTRQYRRGTNYASAVSFKTRDVLAGIGTVKYDATEVTFSSSGQNPIPTVHGIGLVLKTYNGLKVDSLLATAVLVGLAPSARPSLAPAARRFDLHEMGIFLGRKPRPATR